MTKRIAIATIGTLGDVQPFVALALTLKLPPTPYARPGGEVVAVFGCASSTQLLPLSVLRYTYGLNPFPRYTSPFSMSVYRIWLLLAATRTQVPPLSPERNTTLSRHTVSLGAQVRF